MRPVILPPGLEDKSLEIYIHKRKLRILHNGHVISFEELPSEFRELLEQDLIRNRPAITSLLLDFKIEDPNMMLEQYVMCNFGNFDGEPDIDEDGVLITECWDCGLRGECPGEGKVCSRIKGPNGMLTKRETEIFFLVVEGKIDKEIANEFGSSIPTVLTQLKSIREKLGVNNRVEIMGFALKRKMRL